MRILLIALAIVVLAAVAYARYRPRQALSADAQVIEQLRKAGSNLSKPHSIDFNLDFTDESSAEAAHSELVGRGYTSDLHEIPDAAAWSITVKKIMLPREADIATLGREFSTVASKHNGSYDGWGAEVVP